MEYYISNKIMSLTEIHIVNKNYWVKENFVKTIVVCVYEEIIKYYFKNKYYMNCHTYNILIEY